MPDSADRQCFHCKQWIEAGTPHDCWTTTEAALTRDLPEHLRDAWQRLRESAVEFGEQRIYASHNSIMFARRVCYFFVRPRPTALEVCFFLGRTESDPRIRRSMPSSRSKVGHIVRITHRDEVEPPLTEWLAEAYRLQNAVPPTTRPKAASSSAAPRSRLPKVGRKAAGTKRPKTTGKRAGAAKASRRRSS